MCVCESVSLSSVLLLFKRGVLIACQIVFMTLLHNATDSFIYLYVALNYLQNELFEAMVTRWAINRLESNSSRSPQSSPLNTAFEDQMDER